MNEKFDLLTEKYTSILCGIVVFIESVFDFNNTSIIMQFAIMEVWIDTFRWIPFFFAVFNVLCFFMAKKITKIYALDINCFIYPALQLLEQHPQEKKRFYRHFDKITYSSLLVAIITMFYPNLCNFYPYHTIYISITMGLTAYMFSQIIIVYVILDKFKKYSLKARKQSK